MRILQLTVLFPFLLGILMIFIPKRWFKYGGISAVISGISLIWGGLDAFPYFSFSRWGIEPLIQADVLSLSLIMLTGLFGIIVALYTIGHMEKKAGFFWSLFCWILGSASVVFMAVNSILFMVGWGLTGLILALMVWKTGGENTWKKTFIILGGSDALLLMGMAGIIGTTGALNLSGLDITLSGTFDWVIFLLLLSAAFTKAGAFPFHTWIPDTSRDAPVPVVALLPASLDKLLGIYLLKKIAVDWFVLQGGANTLLMAVGAFTILAGVFMALAQHNLKRLLGYHAVSQVGYMILGIGTGTLIGIAGGLLHMVNNAIYKQGLFLGAGVVEKETGTSKLENLGGLYKKFPVTFISFTICAIAISGLPPLNGFISKWMVYQSLIEKAGTGGLWVLWLVAAVFGSVLTLASFVKIVHAAFLGQPSKGRRSHAENISWEVPALVVLPLLCLGIGIFPEYLVYPLLNIIVGDFVVSGVWFPQLAASLFVLGMGIGILLYIIFKVRGYRRTEPYIGGEKITPNMRVSGVEFYTTIENLGIFRKIYAWAREGYFDIYERLKEFTFYWIRFLRWLHGGVVTTYVLWVIVGTVVLMFSYLR
ncbi:MAG: NADH-quinone oxidoreductase subunit L [Elusimicrobiota bacterium]